MDKLGIAFLGALKESDVGVILVAIAAIVVAGMSVYGMIVALKKRGQ